MASSNDDNKKPLSMEELIALAKKLDTGQQKPAEVEPSADLRQAALAMRQMHNAFVWAGWTDDQAVQLTVAVFNKSQI